MSIKDYAVSEWDKYISLAGIKPIKLDMVVDDSDFNKSVFCNEYASYDSKYDDAFTVNINGEHGKIVATNERSLLLAVYEALRKLGFTFCFPGKAGEYIPKGLDSLTINISFTHYAENRYRGVAMCGPKEILSVLDYLDWMPKVGLNTYFMEFWSNHLGWKSWYLKEENPYVEKDTTYNLELGLKYDKELWKRAKERGLICHAMGHGWNVAVLSNDVYNDFEVLPTTVIDYEKIALVNGKRELPMGYVRCANLCLSQKAVQEKIINLVVDFAKNNGHVDFIQLIFGDSINRVCECDECKKKSLYEWLILILNKVDKALTENGLDVKIVFSMYNDLLWCSDKEKLNGDRFVMQYCPISRDYSRSFLEVDVNSKIKPLPPYELNNLKAPVHLEDFVNYFKNWRQISDCEAYCFDYQGYYSVRYDVSNKEVSKLTVDDVRAYKKLGLNGLISCQFYRNAFPHSFLCYATARALFDKDFDLEKEEQTYFQICFGSLGEDIDKYLTSVKDAMPLKDYQWYGEIEEYREVFGKPRINAEKILNLKKETILLKDKIKVNKSTDNLKKTCSKVFGFYLLTIDALCDIYLMKANGEDKEKMLKRREDIKEVLCKNENFLLPYVSIDHVLQAMYWFIVN